MPSTPDKRLAQAVEVAENILSHTFGRKVKLHGPESPAKNHTSTA